VAKKKFSQGLEDLFNDLPDTTAAGNAVTELTAGPPPREPRPTGKNFAIGIDALLQEAFEESLTRHETGLTKDTTAEPTLASGKTKATARPSEGSFSGLDALIRQTVDIQDMQTDEATGKRRLVVAVDRSKFDRLKNIARLENAFLKDILVELIDGYITQYTQDKGISL
jgi:hypothetical protein